MLFWFNCTLIFLLNGIKKRLKRHFFGVLFGYANMFFIFVSLSRNIISFLKFVWLAVASLFLCFYVALNAFQINVLACVLRLLALFVRGAKGRFYVCFYELPKVF